tara:strand:+ start:1184 stop:1360 length:177 start_codon:yes stop_codon:yes gene_type:complete
MLKFMKQFLFPTFTKELETPRLWVKVNKFSKSIKEKENIIIKVIEDLDREIIVDKKSI